jgi:uncharacterized membrane protein
MGMGASQPQFDIGQMLSRSWQVFTANVGVLLGGLILFALIQVAVNGALALVSLPAVGPLIIGGPLTLGYAAVSLRLVRGERVEFGDLFMGFQRFLPAFLANLIIGIFVAIGTFLCVIPGLVVAVLYGITFFFMFDRNQDFWPAMESSRQTVMEAFWPWCLVWLVLFALNLGGAIVCGVGLLLSIPVSALMLALAYDQVAGAGGGYSAATDPYQPTV